MKLRQKLLGSVLALTLLPMGGAALLVHRTLTGHLEENAGRELEGNVEQAAAALNTFFRQRQADLRIFASSPTLGQGTPAAIAARLDQLALLSFFYDALYLADLDGRVIAATESAAAGRPLTDVFPELADELAQIAENASRHVVISDFTDLSPAMQARAAEGSIKPRDLRLQLLTHVLDGAGRPRSLLVGVVGTAGVEQLVTDLDDSTVGDTAAFLLGPDGRVLITAAARVRTLQTHPDWPALRPAVRAAGATSGHVAYQDSAGRKVLTSFATTEKLHGDAGGWMVISTAPFREIMAPEYRLVRGLMWLFCGLVLAAVAAGLWAARRLLRPLEAVTVAAQDLAAGRLEARAPVQGGDELAVLARAFNEMAQIRQQSEETLRASEVQMKIARDAAEAASRAKSDFLANMSHEIRTPMNGVLGTISLLLNTPLTAIQRELAGLARASGETLLVVINDILDFAKVEAGMLTIEPIPFNLLATVEEVAGILAPQAQEKGLDLVVRFAPDAPRRVVGDRGRIRQVIVNLAANGLKFTERGHLLIEVEALEQTKGEALFRFRIEDTGIGIAPEQLGKIFEKFTQADTSTTRRFGGTGLGLAISKQVVELMGGTLTAESRLGEGSAFSFTLRLARQEGANGEARQAPLAGVRVLIVDDHEINRRVLREQVAGWQMRPETCPSGEDALRLLRAAQVAVDPFRIAIIDHAMDGMDGFELAREVKSDPALCGTALVMLTSLGRRRDLPFPEDIAVSLTKPARQSELFAALGEVLSAAAPAAPVADAGPSPVLTRHARVLLTEDHTVNQKVGRMMLESLGCQVEIARDGREAVEKVAAHRYDIIFMDCEMPVMDGFEATAAIRGRGDEKARVPIVALTAKAISGDRERCLAAGMDDYLSKPVQPEDFARTLDRWAPRPAERPAPEPATPPPAAPVGEPALDPAIIGNLRRIAAATPGLLDEIFGAFLTDTTSRLPLLREAARTADGAALRSTAHALKGACANLGARRMASLADQLQHWDAAESPSAASALIGELADEFERVRRELEMNLATPP